MPERTRTLDRLHDRGVLAQGSDAVDRYLAECRRVGFDIVEVSSGFITLPPDDFVRLVERVQGSGLKAKPELGVQFGAGGATAAVELAAEGTRDPGLLLRQGRRLLDAGAEILMIWGTKSLWGRVLTYRGPD